MAVHSWQRRPTRYFGEVWVPIVPIALQGVDGQFQPLALQIDSGAVISLLRRSTADLLGIDWETGREIELSSVGGAPTRAHLHSIMTEFPGVTRRPVQFAIAESESVPNLLGRVDVFESIQIQFDPTSKDTTLLPPWLDATGRRMWDLLLETEDHILHRWSDTGLYPPANVVAKWFIERAAQILADVTGLLKLHRRYGAPLYVRAMWELALQYEYLMRDPLRRAQQYADYAKVTAHESYRKTMNLPPSPLVDIIAGSPRRSEGETRLEQDYQAVVSQFRSQDRKGKMRLWSNWYDMSVVDFAKHIDGLNSDAGVRNEIGWETEYRFIYAACSEWAHADPFSTRSSDLFAGGHPRVLLMTCLSYYARILRRVSQQIVLTNEQHELLKSLANKNP